MQFPELPKGIGVIRLRGGIESWGVYMKNVSARTNNKEKGMLTVEAVLTLIPFVLCIMGLISFINIFMVHNKIQYAMYETANELSGYSYFYQALGLRDADRQLNTDADKATEPIDKEIDNVLNVMDKLQSVKTSVNTAAESNISNAYSNYKALADEAKMLGESGKKLADSTMELIKDPKSIIAGLVYMGVEKLDESLKSWLLQTLASGMIEGYIDQTNYKYRNMLPNIQTADQYLKTFGIKDGIKGLDYSGSRMFSKMDGFKNIDIVVQYDLEIFFFKILPFDDTLHIVQRVKVPAWLDGDGVNADYETK